MTSAGDRIDQHVQILRMLMTRDNATFEDALAAAGTLIPDNERDAVIRAYTAQTSTTITVLGPQVISDGGPRSWFSDYDSAKGYYWLRQRAYLAHTLRRRDFELDSLDQSSDKVLSHLENPRGPDGFAVRGLVVGYVQSGKTANFSALIAKAADAGYKIIIVLSGLHNTLRQQTQRRLERDLGHERADGVGEPEPGRRWQWMTGSEMWGDFDSGNTNAAMLQGTQQVIFVVKKNKSRLERLIRWIGNQVPDNVGVLVIDDEADQASINTGGNRTPPDQVDLAQNDFNGDEPDADELNPSAINANIRKLLGCFSRCSYVAYTATPFANVLINPSAFDAEVGVDLFPAHFIISLPQPPGDTYVGAATLFGRDALPGDGGATVEEGLDVIELIPEHEIDLVIPPPRQRAGFQPVLPPSLKQALVDYVLASGAWLTRAGADKPCTMLIHTDMQRAMQNPLGPQVEKELAYIRQQWRYETEYRPTMRARWDQRFRHVSANLSLDREMSFEQIEGQIDRLLRDGIVVRLLNSDWPDNLDFDVEPNLKAVLIGGNKLSRGVTIEGLLVSFYVRETLYYDTLMQMGRWFGYRGEYVDLTRLYTTETLMECFHDLATAEEELRRQISRYDRDNLTPRQFVPRVRTHPSMAVTQRSKMRDAVTSQINYSGERQQTLRFAVSPNSSLRANLDLTRSFLSSLGEPTVIERQPTWDRVPAGRVLDYVGAYSLIDQGAFDPRSILDYIQAQNAEGELREWRILLSCATKALDDPMWQEDLGVQGIPSIPLKGRTRLRKDPTSLGVVTEPDDELCGLSEDQVRAAQEAFRDGLFDSLAHACRAQRPATEGLMMIYPISAAAVPQQTSTTRAPLFARPENAATLIAFALSFPVSTSQAAVSYVSAPTDQQRMG